MKYLAVGVFVIAGGSILGWVLLAGFCEMPAISSSNACGHNAYYWLRPFIFFAVMLCIFMLKKFVAIRLKRAKSDASK